MSCVESFQQGNITSSPGLIKRVSYRPAPHRNAIMVENVTISIISATSTKEAHTWFASYAQRLLSSIHSFLDLAKFSDDTKSNSVFQLSREETLAELCFLGKTVCKWETEESRRVISCGPAPTSSPHLVCCFYINYKLHYQLWVCSPANRKYCPWRPSFLYLFPSPSIVRHSVFTAFLLLTLLFNAIT